MANPWNVNTAAAAVVVVAGEANAIGNRHWWEAWRLRGQQHQASAEVAAESPKAAAAGAQAR
jgi:hypothetical protein